MMTKDRIIEYFLFNNILGDEVTSWYRSEIKRARKTTAA
jgi:hypothetical protein